MADIADGEQVEVKGSGKKPYIQELTDGGVPRFPSYVGVRLDAEPFPPVTRR